MTNLGYNDAKSGGDTWGTGELLTSGQANAIVQNQRHFAAHGWRDMVELDITGLYDIRDIDVFLTTDGSKRLVYWVGANGTSSTTNVLTSPLLAPEMSEVAHSQTVTGVTGAYAVAVRPLDAAWFGLGTTTGISRGYIRWTGPNGGFSIVNRAGSSSGTKQVMAMAYSPDSSVIVAAWSDGQLERNASGTTWTTTSPTAALSDVKYGGGQFVAMYGTSTSVVYVSEDGISWDSVLIGATFAGALLAYDYAAERWYVMSRDASGANLNERISSAPSESWATVPNVVNPEPGGGNWHSFVSHGGIWGLFSAGVMYLSMDLGQHWTAHPLSGASIQPRAKFAGGRLHVLPNGNGTKHLYTQPFFTPFVEV